MKTEINHPENIFPLPRNLLNPLNKLNTTEIIPTPPEKFPNTSESISIPTKNLNPSRKNLNFPEKLPLPKNSITITEQSQTLELNLNPFPKNSNPL